MVTAGVAVGGALLAPSASPWVLAGLALVALGGGIGLVVGTTQRPHRGRLAIATVGATVGAMLLLGCVVGGRADAAWSGLDHPPPPRIDGTVQLMKDPRPVGRSIRVEVRHDGRRYDMFATGPEAGTITRLRAGEKVAVVGSVAARDPTDRWRASRHVAGMLSVERVGTAGTAWGPWRLANGVHRTLGRGLDALPVAHAGLARAVSVGDRGALPPLVASDMRAGGLSHLTAMSGQHVAMLLVLVAPLLSRLRGGWRVWVLSAVLVAFVIVTRGEPSVLRAVVMAVLVELARHGGNRARGLRVLAMAVTLLVVVDPLIVWSVGFQLSVAATLGICVGATPLAARIRGPRPVATVLAMGICAQLAVAPLAIAYFGSLPITGVIANAFAAPVVGMLMAWLLTAGLVAGVAEIAAPLIHVPTRLLSGWVLGIASMSARSGLGQLHGLHVAALALALAGAAGAARMGIRWGLRVGVAGALAVVAVAALAPRGPAPGDHELASGARLLAGGRMVLVAVDGRAQPAMVVDQLRSVGVVRVDGVVVRTSSASGAAVADAVCQRMGPCVVMVPPGLDPDGVGDVPVTVVAEPVTVDLGGMVVGLEPLGGRLGLRAV